MDSNLYQIYQKVMELLNITNVSPLILSTIVYESELCYILVKEVTDTSVLMAVTKNKQHEVFSEVLKVLTGEEFDNLKNFIRSSDI
ncbi:MAG: hypothetical protein GF383_09045 [Candidatus Lokiarchaeota archaeon]|nr:hypothetical protein [Candidatus Lokiarchaeota archaeon]